MTKEKFLNKFKSEQKLKFNAGFQNWWTEFIFHYNDLHNIVSILNSGKLYSRNKAKSLGLLQVDIADDEVISHTNIAVYDYVRFYFGAKTPTLFHNEGIKPLDEIRNNAHCPVPVFLLFDFVKILSLDDIYFSNGNVGVSSPEIYNDINFLPDLEWNYIYHRNSLFGFLPESVRHIVYCRNAEVLIKNEINIYNFLRWVCVKSEADKETLLFLSSNETRDKIKNKIKVFTQDGLFHNRQLYLNEVRLNRNIINMNFININDKKFSLDVKATSIADSKMIEGHTIDYKITSNLTWDINNLNTSKGVHFIFKIDGNIIYNNIIFDINEILI